MKSDLFPNTKYGYNKRKFTISTLSVCRLYVILCLDIDTHNACHIGFEEVFLNDYYQVRTNVLKD